MKFHEAKFKKSFSSQGRFTKDRVRITAFDKLSELIDSEWLHSIHWPKEDGEILKAINESLSMELEKTEKRRMELMEAKEILSSIEPYVDPDGVD